MNTEIAIRLDIVLENGLDIDIESSIVAVCEIFTKMVITINRDSNFQAPNLHVYAEYCANNDVAIETLSHQSKNSDFVHFENVRITYIITHLIRAFLPPPATSVLTVLSSNQSNGTTQFSLKIHLSLVSVNILSSSKNYSKTPTNKALV